MSLLKPVSWKNYNDINDNGFLPDDVISPYQFFADNHNTENMKPRFF